MIEELRQLHLRGALGATRSEVVNGVEHLVVPCIALQEGVIHAVNAETPEFVSRTALEKSAGKWETHPLVVGHPTKDGKQISAHESGVLDSHGFGTIRSSKMVGTRLGFEVLVNPDRLEALGQKELLSDLRAGKQIEVSVGAYVTTNTKEGTFNGKKYKAEWLEIHPDHLAFLPKGVGACSLAMGCGAHRAAEVTHLVTAEAFEVLGGPGSGWTAEGGHVPGSQGGKSERHTKAASAHEAAASAHEAAALAGAAWEAARSDKSSAGLVAGGHAMNEYDKALNVAMTASKEANSAGKATGTKPFADQAAHTYAKMAGDSTHVKSAAEYHRMAAVHHKAAAFGHTQYSKSLKGLAAGDTPTELQSEEAAELIGYHTIASLLEEVQSHADQAKTTIEECISDEENDPTDTQEDEAAEEEVEAARLESIQTRCSAIIGSASAIMNLCYKMLIPDLPSNPMSTRYMEAVEAAAELNKHIKVLERGIVPLARLTKDCSVCDGTGQVTVGDHQKDCEACDGTGKLKTAAATVTPQLKAACSCQEKGDDTMSMTKEKRAELIAALTTNKFSGFKEGDEPFLTTATDVRLEEFKAAAEKNEVDATAKAKAETELVDAKAKVTVLEGKLKTAEAAPTEEEWIGRAPAGIKALLDNQKAQETELREGLIKTLKGHGANTEDELKAMDTKQLQTLATYAKVEKIDYSGRGLPRAAQQEEDDFNPPDPYKDGIKALQEQKVN